MVDFNRHDAAAGHCSPLQVNVSTLSEQRDKLARQGQRPMNAEEEKRLFPEGDGPLKIWREMFGDARL